jgi:hypothetical protein
MIIESVANKLPIHFDHEKIKTLEYDRDGILSVYGKDKNILCTFKTPASVAFNRQYGTPISKDGKIVFIGVWEKGLYCYSLMRGKMLWRQGPGKVRRIIVFDKELIIEMADRGIYKRNIEDGKKIQEFKMSSISTFRQIKPDQLFAGPKYGKYFIYKIPSMELLSTINKNKLNIHDCISFVIRKVFYRNDKLMIEGFENYKNRSRSNNNQQDFIREVLIDSGDA